MRWSEGGKRGRGPPNKIPFVAAVAVRDGKPTTIHLRRVEDFTRDSSNAMPRPAWPTAQRRVRRPVLLRHRRRSGLCRRRRRPADLAFTGATLCPATSRPQSPAHAEAVRRAPLDTSPLTSTASTDEPIWQIWFQGWPSSPCDLPFALPSSRSSGRSALNVVQSVEMLVMPIA
jgi:hypothetical protein